LYTRGNSERQRTMYDYELAYQRLRSLVGEDYLKQLETVQ